MICHFVLLILLASACQERITHLRMADDKVARDIASVTPYAAEDPKLEKIHGKGDAALDFLDNKEAITFTREEEKAVRRKIDRVLMPLVRIIHRTFAAGPQLKINLQMIISYTIQFMDKSVMAQSAVYDLQSSLHLHGQQYSWCS